MRLSELLAEESMDQRALRDLDITGLTADSRAVQPGFLFAAKLRLFSDVLMQGGTAVLNADSSEIAAFDVAARQRDHRVLKYGKAGDSIKLVNSTIEGTSQVLDLNVLAKSYRVRLPLAGTFQVSNALCALGFAIASGADTAAAVAALEHLEGVPGRMQRAGVTGTGAHIYVDYAHTPDALETVLNALRPHATGTLAVVFGCGGDRDKGKRRIMGEISSRLADAVYVTDDNPRSEVPATIRAEIMQGCPTATEIGDRADAIAYAIGKLSAGDVLLVAGKGHENGQIIGTTVIPFNDVDVVRSVPGVRA